MGLFRVLFLGKRMEGQVGSLELIGLQNNREKYKELIKLGESTAMKEETVQEYSPKQGMQPNQQGDPWGHPIQQL